MDVGVLIDENDAPLVGGQSSFVVILISHGFPGI